jgi:hypothetical protein
MSFSRLTRINGGEEIQRKKKRAWVESQKKESEGN